MQDLINKFIGMNSETRKRTVAVVVLAVIDALSAFGIVQFNDAQIDAIKNLVLVIVTGFVWFYCSHYKNNDFTDASLKGTGITRQIKLEQDPDYVGERFYTNQYGDLIEHSADADYEEPEKVDGDQMAAEEMAAEMKAEKAEKEDDKEDE